MVNLQVNDGGHIRLGEGLIEDGFVQPVQELRPEGLAQKLKHLAPGRLGDGAVRPNPLQEVLGA